MLTEIHNILIGGSIIVAVTVGALITILFGINVIFGGSFFSKVAKELSANEKESNFYEAITDGLHIFFGENHSSNRIKSGRSYFFVATAFIQTGYLGIFDRRYDMYAAKCYPDAAEIKSDDSEFNEMFFVHGEDATFAANLLASPAHRETLRSLRNAGFAEVLFNETHSFPQCGQVVLARIPLDRTFGGDDVTPLLVRRTAKLLRELTTA